MTQKPTGDGTTAAARREPRRRLSARLGPRLYRAGGSVTRERKDASEERHTRQFQAADLVLFAGDLNYRVDRPREEMELALALDDADAEVIDELLERGKLRR